LKKRSYNENSGDLQRVSVKRHQRSMLLDWRLAQTPYKLHRLFTRAQATPEQSKSGADRRSRSIQFQFARVCLHDGL
jgi:hypothetical protein